MATASTDRILEMSSGAADAVVTESEIIVETNVNVHELTEALRVSGETAHADQIHDHDYDSDHHAYPKPANAPKETQEQLEKFFTLVKEVDGDDSDSDFGLELESAKKVDDDDEEAEDEASCVRWFKKMPRWGRFLFSLLFGSAFWVTPATTLLLVNQNALYYDNTTISLFPVLTNWNCGDFDGTVGGQYASQLFPLAQLVRFSLFLASSWAILVILWYAIRVLPTSVANATKWFFGECSVTMQSKLEYIHFLHGFISIAFWMIFNVIIYTIIFPQWTCTNAANWTTGLNVLCSLMILSFFCVIQRLVVQSIAVRFHILVYEERIKQSKKAIKVLDRLRKAIKTIGFTDIFDLEVLAGNMPFSKPAPHAKKRINFLHAPANSEVQSPHNKESMFGWKNQPHESEVEIPEEGIPPLARHKSDPNVRNSALKRNSTTATHRSSSEVPNNSKGQFDHHHRHPSKENVHAESPKDVTITIPTPPIPPSPTDKGSTWSQWYRRPSTKDDQINHDGSPMSDIPLEMYPTQSSVGGVSLDNDRPSKSKRSKEPKGPRTWANYFGVSKNRPEKKAPLRRSLSRGVPRSDTESSEQPQTKSSIKIGGSLYGKLNSTQVLSEAHALKLARKLFIALQGRNQDKDITAASFLQYFPTRKQAEQAFNMFDKDGNGSVSKREMKQAVLFIYRERRNLFQSLRDLSEALGRLNLILYAFSLLVTVLISLPIFGISLNAVLPFTTILVAMSFIFGGSAKNTFECIIFLFVAHPYDAGDRVSIDGVGYVVLHVNLLTTIFTKEGQKVYAPNSAIANKVIFNIRRSGDQSETVEFWVDYFTPEEKLRALRDRMFAFVQAQNRDYMPVCEVNVTEFDNSFRLKCTMPIVYKGNWQDWSKKSIRKTNWMFALKKNMMELGLEIDDTVHHLAFTTVDPGPRSMRVKKDQ